MNIKICCVCESDNSKYKCPKCRQFYCSIVCCNKHKEKCSGTTHSDEPDVAQNLTTIKYSEYDFPTEDTVPIEKLEQLRCSKEVKVCLENPQLRDIITSVLNNKNPTEAIAKAMMEPVFVELADTCLKVVEVSDNDKPC